MAGYEFEILTYNWDPPYNEGRGMLTRSVLERQNSKSLT